MVLNLILFFSLLPLGKMPKLLSSQFPNTDAVSSANACYKHEFFFQLAYLNRLTQPSAVSYKFAI